MPLVSPWDNCLWNKDSSMLPTDLLEFNLEMLGKPLLLHLHLQLLPLLRQLLPLLLKVVVK
jgi:hypothetical protein